MLGPMANMIALGATCFAGLGPLVSNALARIPATNIAICRIRDYDFVSFRLDRKKLRGLHSLHLVEDIFLQLAHTSRINSSADVRKLCAHLNRSNVLDSIAYKNDFSATRSQPRKKLPSYFCFVRQNRDHPVHRKTIANGVMSAVGRIFPRWRANDPADLEFWVFWSDDISLMLRLSDETLKYRSQAPPKLRAALRPTIAAAMVELSKMKSNHAVLDPLCGTGTLLAECGARFPDAKLFGSDISPDAVAIATKRLGDKASIRRCEFDNLPHTQGSFDRIITNLPWGKQVPVQQDLYNAGLARMLDWVVDDGMVVLLTPRRDLLEPSLRRLRARWSATSVRVLGTWASIYVVTKPRNRSPLHPSP